MRCDHGLRGSNKLLYKECAKSMKKLQLLPPFSTDFNKTQNQERYLGYDSTCKIWLMWDNGKGVCVRRAFFVTFCVFFVFLLTPTNHTKSPITTIYSSKRVFPRKVKTFKDLNNKKIMFGSKLCQKVIFGA